MNESFSDPTKINNVEYSKNPVGEIKNLCENDVNAVWGGLASPSYGGGTSVPEFEALTGLSSYYLAKQIFPFTNYMKSDLNSIVREYKKADYTTIGIHPNTQTFYNRGKAYKYLGFDKTVFGEDIENPEIKGGNVSDNEFANLIIKNFEEASGNKFIFGVTIQNHMPYNYQRYDTYDIEVMSKELSESEKAQLTTYVQGVYDGNKMYMKLVEYLRNVQEPTILIMFGDHLPSFSSIYEKSGYDLFNKLLTPYIIWANYDIDYSKYLTEYMSPSNLSIEIMKIANIEIPWYLKNFEELYAKYPAFNNQLIMDNEGNILKSEECVEDELIKKCKILQYDLLIKKKYIEVR